MIGWSDCLECFGAMIGKRELGRIGPSLRLRLGPMRPSSLLPIIAPKHSKQSLQPIIPYQSRACAIWQGQGSGLTWDYGAKRHNNYRIVFTITVVTTGP